MTLKSILSTAILITLAHTAAFSQGRPATNIPHLEKRGTPRSCRRPLHQADTMRAGARHQVHGGGQQVRVGPVSVSQRQVSEPDGWPAVEVQFYGDSLALHQTPPPPQLV